MTNRSLTERLATWLLARRETGFSADVLQASPGYILDWLGSALAGGATEPGQMLREYATKQPIGPCQIIGADLTGSAETAALVNGGLSHIVEMDDLDRKSVLHPATVVIPAALAIAEREGRSGRDFLEAVIAGYEIAIRIGEAVGKRHYYYFHNTATCGAFGAAAAAGWLLGLNEAQFVWALGNAGTQAAGLWQFNAEGNMSKHLHAGRAAANGVLAADLAARNFTGARHILEGERGFFAATAPDAEPDLVVSGLDEQPLKLCGVSIKPHASCRHTHPAIDAALTLHNLRNEREIVRCHIDTYQAVLDLCDNPDPQTPYAAKFSLHYCVATTLVRGSAGLADFLPQCIQQPAIQALLPRITVAQDADYESRYPTDWSSRVTLTLADGQKISEAVRHPKGDPENPLTWPELKAKFQQLASYAQQGDHVDRWLAWLDALQTDQKLTTLSHFLKR